VIEDELNREMKALEKSDWDKVFQWQQSGLPRGISLGWPETDPYIRLFPGSLTVVTGRPGSGKSLVVNQISVNMYLQHNLRSCSFSPEEHPTALHRIKLCEKMTGKPFDKRYGDPMKAEELELALQEVIRNFKIINPPSHDIDTILENFEYHRVHSICRIFIIDPITEIHKCKPKGESDTEYLNKTLSKIQIWAREKKVYVIIVVHPHQPEKGNKNGVVGMYDLYGGSMYANKMDFFVSIRRDFDLENANEFYVLKVRQARLYGSITKTPVSLRYHPETEMIEACSVL